MASRESPRAAITRAEYFHRQATSLRGDQRAEFEHNIAAAIVFGRSAYHFLQSRALAPAADPAFVAWFKAKRVAMASDRLLEYFRRERDTTLKERHRGLGIRAFATAAVGAFIAERPVVVIGRSEPWYRRSPSTLWQDFWATVTRPLKRWRFRASLRVQRLEHALRSRRDRLRTWWRARRYVPSVREFYLDDPEGLDRNAIDLVAAYLSRLDAIIAEAEARYPASVA